MWDSVLLDGSLGYAFLKLALDRQYLQMASPEDRSEEWQVERFRQPIMRARCTRDALAYSLLAETVYVDLCQTQIYSGLDLDIDDERFAERQKPVFTLQPELASFVRLTDSGQNHFVANYLKPAQERANIYAAMEPLIWNSWRRNLPDLGRGVLRDALDLLVVEPSLLEAVHDDDARDFEDLLEDAASRAWSDSPLTTEYLGVLSRACHVATVKAGVAENKIAEAMARNAVYPVRGLSFGRNRYLRGATHFSATSSDDIVASTRVFLDELRYWPVVSDISDVIMIRQKKAFTEFREILRSWVTAVASGDASAEEALRKEIGKANSAMRTSITCASVGRWFTYIGVPMLVLDCFIAPVFGAAMTVAGFGLQAYSDWKSRDSRWLLVGK